MPVKDITILGGGLVGSLNSIFLAKMGYNVALYEKRPDPRYQSSNGNRSINLTLTDRGLRSLKVLGLDQSFISKGIQLQGRFIHNQDGTLKRQKYSMQAENHYLAMNRILINQELLNEAEKNGVKLHFNASCLDIDPLANEFIIQNTLHNKETAHKSDFIFGCDGAYSSLRFAYLMKNPRMSYKQFYVDHGYIQLTIPENIATKSYFWEKNWTHLWPRKSFTNVAFPNANNTYTCTLFMPFEGPEDFAYSNVRTQKRARQFFEKYMPDLIESSPGVVSEFLKNPFSSMITVKMWPWSFGGRSMLLGDSAHAIVPFYGQGMNCGFEDCLVLKEVIEKNNHNWDLVVDEFQRIRKPSADAIMELALGNFTDLCSNPLKPNYFLEKALEEKLHRKYPFKWIPLHSAVSFRTDLSFYECLQRGKNQRKVMESILRIPELESKWDSREIEEQMIKMVEELNEKF